MYFLLEVLNPNSHGPYRLSNNLYYIDLLFCNSLSISDISRDKIKNTVNCIIDIYLVNIPCRMLASAVFRRTCQLHADIWRQVHDRRLGIPLWIQPQGLSIKLKTCVLLLAFEFISLTIMLFNRESFLSCVYFHYYSWSVNCSKWMAISICILLTNSLRGGILFTNFNLTVYFHYFLINSYM